MVHADLLLHCKLARNACARVDHSTTGHFPTGEPFDIFCFSCLSHFDFDYQQMFQRENILLLDDSHLKSRIKHLNINPTYELCPHQADLFHNCLFPWKRNWRSQDCGDLQSFSRCEVQRQIHPHVVAESMLGMQLGTGNDILPTAIIVWMPPQGPHTQRLMGYIAQH